MSTLNWCEIGPVKTHRYDFLSQHLTSQGIPNQFTFIESTSENLKQKTEEAKVLKQFIRFHPRFFDQPSVNINNNLRELEFLKSLDVLMFDEKKGYWPSNLLKESLLEFLTLRIKNLDVMQKALIVGTCGLARAAVAALVKIGYSKINITGEDDNAAKDFIKDFEQIYFNVTFEFTKKADVTILPGIHGLVVNAISVLDSENVPLEIYYFNFLKKGGLVLELIDLPTESPFTRIAADIGAQVVQGYEFLAYYDLMWVEKVTGRKLELEPYKTFLKTNLDQLSYDKNKIQKILEEFQM